MVVCPRCGSELREGARFCGKCGAAIKAIDEKKRICPVCGKEVKSTARFCSSCGANLTELPAENLPAQSDNLLSIQSDYMQWNILPGQIAVRIDQQDMMEGDGIKGLSIQPGIKAFIIADGHIIGNLEAGNYKLDSLISGKISLFQKFKNYIKNVFKGKTSVIDGARFISIVLLRGVEFPLVSSYQNMKSNDVSIDVAIHFICQITNIIDFYNQLLVDRKSVTYASFSSFLEDDVRSMISRCLSKDYDAISDTDSLISEVFPLLQTTMMDTYPFLSVKRIVSLSVANEDLEKIHKMEEELFVSEQELDHLSKRNDFIVRLNSENNRHALAMAENESDYLALLEKIDEKNLLTNDERDRFALMLSSQKKLREAKTHDEEEQALSDIRKSRILRESEIAELEHMVAHKAELQNLKDAQIIAKATIENRIDLGNLELRYEEEIENRKLANDIERRKAEDQYNEEKRRREAQREKEESLSQLDILRQAQEIRIAREEAEHKRKLEEMKAVSDAELERNRLYASMSADQIMAINPDISPEAAKALAEKFKNDSNADKLQFAIDQKNEMRSFMESQMALMRDMILDGNSVKKDMFKAKDAEIARVRAEANENQNRYTHVMETTVQAVAKGNLENKKSATKAAPRVIICSNCKAENPIDSLFCGECGASLQN